MSSRGFAALMCGKAPPFRESLPPPFGGYAASQRRSREKSNEYFGESETHLTSKRQSRQVNRGVRYRVRSFGYGYKPRCVLRGKKSQLPAHPSENRCKSSSPGTLFTLFLLTQLPNHFLDLS